MLCVACVGHYSHQSIRRWAVRVPELGGAFTFRPRFLTSCQAAPFVPTSSRRFSPSTTSISASGTTPGPFASGRFTTPLVPAASVASLLSVSKWSLLSQL